MKGLTSKTVVRIALIAVAVVMILGVGAVLALRGFGRRLAATAARSSAPPMTQQATRPWDGQLHLCWGGTFRALGMCDNAASPQWWDVDGTPIASPPLPPRVVKGVHLTNGIGTDDPNRQFCYSVTTPENVQKGDTPSLTIDGKTLSVEYGEIGDFVGKAFTQPQRYAFDAPATSTLTLHAKLKDERYATFVVVTPNQTAAGPLKVAVSVEKDGNLGVKFSGEWQYPAQVAVVLKDGSQAERWMSFSTSGALGSSIDSEFKCKPEEVKEIHFRMCGLQRFVVTGIAANPKVRSTPLVAEEHISPLLAGKPPIDSAELPPARRDPQP